MSSHLNLVKPWRTHPPVALCTTRIFTLYSRRCDSPTNPAKSGDFVYLDPADWVNVIALTSAREVVMIEQYRHGLDEITLELPGGIVDPGEDPMAACTRELLEETGYAPPNTPSVSATPLPARPIGVVSANPAIMTNRVHTGLIDPVVHSGPQHLDGNEEIAVRLVPLADVPGLIRSGVIHHSLVVAAFHHLALAS
jgi:8-oxo-dGTP pyrophosphatase MutT (NUDIX family)